MAQDTARLNFTQSSPLSDEEVVARVRAGDTALYEVLMRRYNQRLYRVARAILRNDAEAEDVMQDAYVRAYQLHLADANCRSRSLGALAPSFKISIARQFRGIQGGHYGITRIGWPQS